MRNRHDERAGFTLLEVMAAVVIIGILLGGGAVAVLTYISKANVTRAKSDLQKYKDQVTTYKMLVGKYPKSLNDLTEEQTKDDGNKVDALIDGIDNDPWGRPYLYDADENGFEIKTYGRDGRPGGEGEEADLSTKRGNGD